MILQAIYNSVNFKGITISWPTGRSTTFTVIKRKERAIVKCKGQHHIVYTQIENYGTICDQRNSSCSVHVSHHASTIRVSFHFLGGEVTNIHLQHFCFANQAIISRNSINGQHLLPQLQLEVQLSSTAYYEDLCMFEDTSSPRIPREIGNEIKCF